MLYISSCKSTKKKLLPSNVFEIHVFTIRTNLEFLLLPIGKKIKGVILFKKKLLVSVEELLNVVEMVCVEEAPSASFARYRMKISILECCRFQSLGT